MFQVLLLRAMPFRKGIHSNSFFTLVRLSVTHVSIAAAESNAVALKVYGIDSNFFTPVRPCVSRAVLYS